MSDRTSRTCVALLAALSLLSLALHLLLLRFGHLVMILYLLQSMPPVLDGLLAFGAYQALGSSKAAGSCAALRLTLRIVLLLCILLFAVHLVLFLNINFFHLSS